MILKLNQKVVLPCQETIGEVIAVDENLNKVIIRSEKNGEKFDFTVTLNGYLPYSETEMVEEIPFIEKEIVIKPYVSNPSLKGVYRIGKLTNIRLQKQNLKVELVADFYALNLGNTNSDDQKENNTERQTIQLSECKSISELHSLCLTAMSYNTELYKNKSL